MRKAAGSAAAEACQPVRSSVHEEAGWLSSSVRVAGYRPGKPGTSRQRNLAERLNCTLSMRPPSLWPHLQECLSKEMAAREGTLPAPKGQPPSFTALPPPSVRPSADSDDVACRSAHQNRL